MTVGAYSSRAARFLARYAPDGDPAVIAPGDVTAAVLADASGLSAGAGGGSATTAGPAGDVLAPRAAADVAADAALAGEAGCGAGGGTGQVEALLAACDRTSRTAARLRGHPERLARLARGEAARLAWTRQLALADGTAARAASTTSALSAGSARCVRPGSAPAARPSPAGKYSRR